MQRYSLGRLGAFIFFQKEPSGNTLHRGRGGDIIINVSQSKRLRKMPGGSTACILAPGAAALCIEESEMANYREFYEQTRRRKRKAAWRRFAAAIVVLGAVLAAALLLVRCGKQAEPAPAATEKPQTTAAQAPLKAQTGREDDGSWNTREPVEQTIDGEIRSADYRMLALPANGKADSSYLNGVTFLGDSLTQGFQTYTGLEAKDRSYFCAYKGMGVKQVVDDAAVKNLAGEEQVPMQALIDSQPDNVYVELGVNTLNNTTDESFIAYYLPTHPVACICIVRCIEITVGIGAADIVHGRSHRSLDARVIGRCIDSKASPTANAEYADTLRIHIGTCGKVIHCCRKVLRIDIG